ncbi:Dyp-type peroxidase, partial [Phlegmacium glaucopus]
LVTFIPLIKTVAQVLQDRKAIEDHKKKKLPGLVPLVGVNIAISHKGFAKLGIDDSSLSPGGANDPFFLGQEQDAINSLGDPRKSDGTTPDWDDHFLQDIHGLILISGESLATIEKKKAEIDLIFKVNTPLSSIKEIITIRGDVRPGDQSAHEHFGFLDGVSNPAVNGFDTVIDPGPNPVDPGVIVTGHAGDPALLTRAPWAVDGSFLVFRWLFQQVPEFDEFLKAHPLAKDGNGKELTPAEGSDLLGARIVGRWKSGAPIDITPFQDDPELGADPARRNNFRFAGEGSSQLRCPFAAHVRKTNPRDDLEAPPPPNPASLVQPRRIMRRGVQFGPELTAAEIASGKTQHSRGLLFTCYQASIFDGFQFLQLKWADNKNFPPFTGKPFPAGLDPLIGQGIRVTAGLDPNNESGDTTLDPFIIPKGGEYFFSPGLNGLKSTIAKA